MKTNQKSRIPLVGVLWIVFSAVQLLLCQSGYIMSNLEQLLIMLLCAVALVAAVVAGLAWDVLPPFRKGLRGTMVVLPSVLAILGLLLPLYVLIVRPEGGLLLMSCDASYGYNTLASLSFMLFVVQVLQVFALPSLAVAATFGNRFDVWHFRIHACVNAVLLAFNVFVSSTSFVGLPHWDTADVASPSWYIPNVLVPDGSSELLMVQVVVLVVAAVTAGLSFLPLPAPKTAGEE